MKKIVFLLAVLCAFTASANPDPGPLVDSDWFDQDQRPDDQIETDNDPSDGDEVGCALILL